MRLVPRFSLPQFYLYIFLKTIKESASHNKFNMNCFLKIEKKNHIPALMTEGSFEGF
jgi:hypothetical protein